MAACCQNPTLARCEIHVGEHDWQSGVAADDIELSEMMCFMRELLTRLSEAMLIGAGLPLEQRLAFCRVRASARNRKK